MTPSGAGMQTLRRRLVVLIGKWRVTFVNDSVAMQVAEHDVPPACQRPTHEIRDFGTCFNVAAVY